MANTTVYPFGTRGTLPGSIGIVNDPFTGGADKAFSAEQGKKINEQLNTYKPQDLSSRTAVKAFIATTTDTWSSNYENWKCKFLPVRPGFTYLVKANADRSSSVAVLKDDSHVNGNTPHYATGCTNVILAKGSYYQFTVPSDGSVLYVATLNNNNDCTPESVNLVSNDIVVLKSMLDAVNSQRVDVSAVPVTKGWIIGSANLWSNQGTPSSDFACMLVPVSPGDRYVVAGNRTGGFYALLASGTKSNGSAPVWCEDYQGRRYVNPGETFTFTAPADAAFLYLTIRSSGNDFDHYLAIPKSVDEQFQEVGAGGKGASEVELDSIANLADALANTLFPLSPNLDENGYVVPETLQELNAQRKAEQFAGVKWTPITAVPKNTYNSTNKTFPAGTRVTGVPYSSVKELDKFIGKDVSLHTFMTAVNNPYSLLYTENVSEANSASAWGKTYHGVNCACYFGQVCSEFSAMASGGAIDYATALYSWLNKYYHKAVKIFDQSAQGVRIGDALWTEGHMRMVYAVKKNASGEVTHVRIAESTYGSTIINNPITAAAFNTEIANGCIIYRPLWLYRNINYEPSPYVAIRDEAPQTVVYNDDICTFAGDKACFREGDTIAINYNLKSVGTWTSMQLFKGAALVDTIVIDTAEHVVDLTSRNLTYGKYKARMTDGTNFSDFTEFEILQANVSYVNDGNVTTITPVSANGTPVAVKLCSESGGARAMRELTDDERSAASFDIDLVALNAQQMPGSPVVGAAGLFLKIYFQGEFGRVTNEPLPISFGY